MKVMMMPKNVVAAMLMAVVGSVVALEPEAANPPEARVDVSGEAGKLGMVFVRGSDGVTGGQANWLNDDRDKRLVVRFPATGDWQKHSFTFTAKVDGKVRLEVMGNDRSPAMDKGWFWFDNVDVVGSTLKNGDFEIANDNGRPEGWQTRDGVEVGGSAQSGKVAVKTHHDCRIMQDIEVKAGQAVTVSLWVKNADVEAKENPVQ
jgi:hypothetical protein